MSKSNFTKPRSLLLITLLLSFILLSSTAMAAKDPKNLHGFKLIEKRFIKELNADGYLLEHIKSGARLFKIASSDPNKTFTIGFKTIPDSDCGTAHIIEHTVLSGSKNYPVKSPINVLMKGSLNTFINAFTSKDFTMYPIASMNDKDYFNLMNVYLDAVFNPLIYDDPRIFKQEAWHYELTDKDNPLIYKGVVYGEMKGAFSNPERELSRVTYKNLFPDNGYGFESGGYPFAIPALTREAYLDFHKHYYHPENSYIFLYGNADFEKELEMIDSQYLSKYEKANNPAVIEVQKPFNAMKDITSYYPVTDGASADNQTFLSLNFVAGSGTDQSLTWALQILTEVLIDQESAPIRLALQTAGIGQDVTSSVNSYQQNTVSITLKNANPKDKEKFFEIVMAGLKEAAEKGVDKREIEGLINSFEFQLREGNDAQKGLSYLFQSKNGFIFANDPFIGLEYEKPLAILKESLKNTYLEDILKKYLLNNPHSLLLTLEPKPGLDNERNAKVEEELKNYKANLNDDAIASLMKETKDLIDFQKRQDPEEAIATIPLLDLKDIDPNATFYSVDETRVNGISVIHHEEFTNKVVYTNLYFDLRVLPQEMIPYASLLSNVIGIMSTEKYTYGELNRFQNNNTGGFNTYLTSYLENQDDNRLIPKFVVSTKAMNNKLDKLFELSNEVINKTRFDDKERLKAILIKHQSQIEARIKADGSQVANNRIFAYFNNQGVFNELTNGMDYYWFITDLVKDFDKNADQIISNLVKVSTQIFSKENLISAVTCDKNDLNAYTKDLSTLTVALPSNRLPFNNWTFAVDKKNEGFLSSSKVQYVVEGYNFKKLGYSWDGKMLVLNRVISRDWLYSRIRVVGGAYGGYSTIASNGNVRFISYRDPNLKETLDNYRKVVDFVSNFDADEKTMKRYIIGSIAELDQPLTLSQKGNRAFGYYFTRTKPEDIQREREAVLSTKKEDIKGYAKMIKEIVDQESYCTYGNAEKIEANKELFKNLVKIDK